ncbi:trimethylamine methyltransferase family protein [Desulfobacterales bacterium]|nr:trimethylamine methyltransferase family protein [Desulfobacterales bacterium]
MARAKMITMDQKEEDLIHEMSIKCLNEIGVCVHSDKVLKMLDENGAVVDYDSMVAKIPETMVNKALETAPSQFTLYGRDSKHDIALPIDGKPKCSTSGLAVFISDLETGEQRNATKEDLRKFIRLADALESVGYVWTSITLSDVPAMAHGAHEVWVTLQNTTKHITSVSAQSAKDALMQIELAALVTGGKENLKKNPILSVVVCPVAPLTFEKGAAEAQVEFAKAGVPISSMSMSMGGISAPVTIAGTISNNNTENLASLVITQTASPGAPHIYTVESTPMEMTTASVNYRAPELPFIANSAAQMARRYQLPCETGSFGGSDKTIGMSKSYCETNTTTLSVMATDLVVGLGAINNALANSYEQLVIDAYLWDCYQAFLNNYEITEEKVALDVVKEVGHGKEFLQHEHTLANFRKELTIWDKKKLAMQTTQSDNMVPEAKAIAKDLIKKHVVPALDSEILEQGNAILEEYDKLMLSNQ